MRVKGYGIGFRAKGLGCEDLGFKGSGFKVLGRGKRV